MNTLIAKLRAQREHLVELEPATAGKPAKSVTVRRPAEAEFGRFATEDNAKLVAEYVVGWAGFSEADLLGEAIGAADIEVPFDPELWREVVRDRVDWVRLVAKRLGELVEQRLQQRGLFAKN